MTTPPMEDGMTMERAQAVKEVARAIARHLNNGWGGAKPRKIDTEVAEVAVDTLAAFAAEQPAEEWRAINRLPLDVWVLAYLPNESNHKQIQVARRTIILGETMLQIGHIFTSDLNAATLWRPLPAPPAKDQH